MALPTQFAYRTLKEIGVINADPVYEPLSGLQKPEGNLRCCSYSPCGRYFAWARPEEVTVIDASTGAAITTLAAQHVYELAFSPRGTFIITWERPAKDEEGNATKNLKVWRVVEEENFEDDATTEETTAKKAVGKFVQRSQSGWNLQYTSDEQYCARLVTNEVQFYKSDDLGTVWNKLRAEGVVDFALSPGNNQAVAVFVPERKGQPAAVKIFNVPEFGSPVSQKTFFKGDKVQLKWNKLGTTLIVLAQTEVDKTGKSYYGETNLYLLSANDEFHSRVELDKEGPIHDVTWSPNSKRFGVVYGYMPTKTTLFNTRANATHTFPLAPRNTISFSPNGRFILVAGFGNLAGQMDIYDGDKDHQKVTTIESGNPSVCQWSPDSKFILTATTSPRLRVDNGVKIWHASGTLLYNEDMTELYDVLWRPGFTGLQTASDALNPVPTQHSSAIAYLGRVKTPLKPAGAYRPPGARGQITPLHFKREDEGGAAHVNNGISSSSMSQAMNSFGKHKRREVPGAEAALPPGAAPGGGVSLTGTGDADEGLSKAAMKNKKKRGAKKAKEAAETAAANLEGSPINDVEPSSGKPNVNVEQRKPHARNQSRTIKAGEHIDHRSGGGTWRVNPLNDETEAVSSSSAAAPSNPISLSSNQAAQPNPTDTTTAGVTSPAAASASGTATSTTAAGGGGGGGGGSGTLEQKKLRGLLKKLRAIDDLKMRLAAGEKLEDTQMKKIASEDSVRRELEEIGWKG